MAQGARADRIYKRWSAALEPTKLLPIREWHLGLTCFLDCLFSVGYGAVEKNDDVLERDEGLSKGEVGVV